MANLVKLGLMMITKSLVDKSSISYKLQELVWKTAKKFDKELKVEDIHIEHPGNPEHGDYATNIALQLAQREIKGNFLENIEWIWKHVKKKNFEEIEPRDGLPVGKLNSEVKKAIKTKDNLVYLKPRVYAKIRGWWKTIPGHKEIKPFHFFLLPLFINRPERVCQDREYKHRVHFIFSYGHLGTIIIDIVEKPKVNEIVTIFYLKEKQLRKMESLWQQKKTSGAGTATPRFSPPNVTSGLPAADFSGLHQKAENYISKIKKECQEDIVNYQIKKSPMERAKEIIDYFPKITEIDKVEVVPPGFINFWLSKEFLLKALAEPVKLKEKYGASQVLQGKKILLEHTSPNPQTTIMVGHLRNNFLGMTTTRMLGTMGAKVIKDCIVNDRGVHICRALFGYLVFAKKDSGLSGKELKNFKEISDNKIKKIVAKVDWKKLIEEWVKNNSDWWVPVDLHLKPDHFNLVSYVLGSQVYSLSKKVKNQVKEILLAWEAEDENVWKLWRKILKDWSALGYQETYRRIGSVHDWVWYESDHYKMGKEIVEMGLKKRVFKKSQGAIVSNLSDYGLPDAVLIKSDGSTLYHTQDLALTKLKQEKFPSDLYIWDIGVEQTLYLKQLFAMCEQLDFGRLSDYFHLSYELINLKGGRKMSTREGTVIPADELLDDLHQKAKKIIEISDQDLRGRLSEKQKEKISEEVGLAAAKYGMLRYARETTIYFDIDESLSLEGNSGPYLQYTYARARSVLRKAQSSKLKAQKYNLNLKISELNTEKMVILRTIYQFSEVVLESAKNFAPNLICNFLFDLAQKFNAFYNKWPIIKAEEEKRNFRLLLTASVAQVLKNGLTLLGIKTLKRM